MQPDPVKLKKSRRMLILLILICAAPVVASYITYYFFQPSQFSNYGTLIQPQRPLPVLTLKQLDGSPADSASLKGKWQMVMVSGGDCPKECQDLLYHIRQVRLTTGKDRDRVARLWLVDDAAPLPTMVMREYDGTLMLRADRKQLENWLQAESGSDIRDHIYIVDPLGNLMMRFPRNADPTKTKKDLARLLAASGIG